MKKAEWERWARLLAMHLETVLGSEPEMPSHDGSLDAAEEALSDYQRAVTS